MIYNLVQYLKDEFPTEKIYTNVKQLEATQDYLPDRVVIVKESSGIERPYYNYTQKTVQILCRDFDVTKSRSLAWKIFKKLTSKFGLIFDAVTVDGETFPQIQTAQINAIQLPTNIGIDDKGRTDFSTNYQIIYVRE